MKNYRLILFFVLLAAACDGFKYPGQNGSGTQYAETQKMTREGEPVEVLVHLSQKKIDISDFLTMTLEIRAKEGVAIVSPYLSEEVYRPLAPVEPPLETGFWSAKKNRHVKIWKYKFEPTDSGRFSLKPFEVFFQPFYKVKTKEIHYLVKASQTNAEDDIRDVKGLIFPSYDYTPLAIAAGASALIIFLLWLSRRRGKWKTEKEPPRKTKRDYFLEALRKLDDLERQDLIGKKEFEKLHVNLSRILRYYIENYFGIRAAEQTTEEFIKYISQSSSFSDEQRATLRDFLSLADLVKFAVFEPRTGVNEEAMRKVRNFIVAAGEDADEV